MSSPPSVAGPVKCGRLVPTKGSDLSHSKKAPGRALPARSSTKCTQRESREVARKARLFSSSYHSRSLQRGPSAGFPRRSPGHSPYVAPPAISRAGHPIAPTPGPAKQTTKPRRRGYDYYMLTEPPASVKSGWPSFCDLTPLHAAQERSPSPRSCRHYAPRVAPLTATQAEPNADRIKPAPSGPILVAAV